MVDVMDMRDDLVVMKAVGTADLKAHLSEDLHAVRRGETIVVLEGSVRIEIKGGPTLDLGVGDMASMPKGAVTTWHPSPDFKEIWFYA